MATRYKTTAAVVSLVAGPLLMSIGDLMHPKEKTDAAEQAAIIVDQASRWYGAHLLLFIGILVLVPGILALSGLVAERRPALGFATRVLLLTGGGAFAAIFVTELLIGRYAKDGAAESAVAELINTFQTGPVFGPVVAAAVAFFIGVGTTAYALALPDGPYRWPALLLALGAVLVIIEIASAQVVFSQAGNIVILAATTWFAVKLWSRDEGKAAMGSAAVA